MLGVGSFCRLGFVLMFSAVGGSAFGGEVGSFSDRKTPTSASTEIGV